MGAPKQKWTAEEEAALKAGVVKHGAGKWRTILTDAEFSSVLCLRSNVDLKDKWRNINVTAIWGSRQKAKLALWNFKPNPNPESDHLPLSTVVQNGEEIVDGAKPVNVSAKPIDQISDETKRNINPKESNVRLDKLILQAIANLKDPRGSDRAAISSYIEGKFNPLANGNGHEQYWTPPDLKRLLSSKLKYMVANGKLLKLKHRYKIPPGSKGSEKRRNISMLPLNNGAQKGSEVNVLTESQVNKDLVKMRSMTAHEAAAAAAQAVAEAEAAMAAAEEAEMEAEAAEAEAEAAQIFAKAAMKAFKCGLRIW